MVCMTIRNEAWLVVALAYTFISIKFTMISSDGNESLQALHASTKKNP